jgi:ubiquinone/menaquinone biosynthesis C-methylase UbiE
LYHDIFSRFYDLTVPFFTPPYYQVIESLVDENVPTGSKVLDLCTGTGNVASAAAKRAKEVIGLDVSQRMLSKARKKA